jgi:hypothetical protein
MKMENSQWHTEAVDGILAAALILSTTSVLVLSVFMACFAHASDLRVERVEMQRLPTDDISDEGREREKNANAGAGTSRAPLDIIIPPGVKPGQPLGVILQDGSGFVVVVPAGCMEGRTIRLAIGSMNADKKAAADDGSNTKGQQLTARDDGKILI